jgi:hypothetical protein
MRIDIGALFPSESERMRTEAVILALIKESGGKIVGTTKLFKAFYFAHLYYARATGSFLTPWRIVRMPNGPGIDRWPNLSDDLKKKNQIASGTERVGPYLADVYQCKEIDIQLEPEAIAAIREAVALVDGETAKRLSELSHEFSRSWNMTENGHEMNIFDDLLTDKEYAERKEIADQISHCMNMA